jgi:Domain of unknown function (DUF4407)
MVGITQGGVLPKAAKPSLFRFAAGLPAKAANAVSNGLMAAIGIDRAHVLHHSDRVRYTTTALTMVLYGLYATAGTATFMSVATQSGAWRWVGRVGVPVALAVMLLDRIIVSHVPVNLKDLEAGEPLYRMPASAYVARILIALVVAAVVTEPVGFVLFRDEIQDQISGERARQGQNIENAIEVQRKTCQQISDADTRKILNTKVDPKLPDRNLANTEDRLKKLNAGRSFDDQQCQKRLSQLAAQTKSYDGVLARDAALFKAIGGNLPAMAYWALITFLLILLDLAAVLFKVTSRGNAYELSYAAAARAELRKRLAKIRDDSEYDLLEIKLTGDKRKQELRDRFQPDVSGGVYIPGNVDAATVRDVEPRCDALVLSTGFELIDTFQTTGSWKKTYRLRPRAGLTMADVQRRAQQIVTSVGTGAAVAADASLREFFAGTARLGAVSFIAGPMVVARVGTDVIATVLDADTAARDSYPLERPEEIVRLLRQEERAPVSDLSGWYEGIRETYANRRPAPGDRGRVVGEPSPDIPDE